MNNRSRLENDLSDFLLQLHFEFDRDDFFEGQNWHRRLRGIDLYAGERRRKCCSFDLDFLKFDDDFCGTGIQVSHQQSREERGRRRTLYDRSRDGNDRSRLGSNLGNESDLLNFDFCDEKYQ